MNPILKQPFAGWMHPDLAKVQPGIFLLSNYMDEMRWNITDEYDDDEWAAVEFIEGLPRYANGLACSVPLLHPDVCDLIIEEINRSGLEWVPNDDEDEDYQIPEIILKHRMIELHESLQKFADSTLFRIMKLLWGRKPTNVRSIQLAKYTPEGTRMSGWHHDEDSNMTAVVNLAPELYTGGGTDVRTGLLTYEHVPPVPKGHALIFNGHQTLHRGAPVESGERNILVFWTTTF